MQLSVVLPVHNEAENIGGLLQEIHDALEYSCEFEVVVVDDGSTDTTPSLLNQLTERFDSLRIVRHRASCGQSTALMTGINAGWGRAE
jgi:dolichol-phosphate mannosyltransferase